MQIHKIGTELMAAAAAAVAREWQEHFKVVEIIPEA
jgi:hypothetical protein